MKFHLQLKFPHKIPRTSMGHERESDGPTRQDYDVAAKARQRQQMII